MSCKHQTFDAMQMNKNLFTVHDTENEMQIKKKVFSHYFGVVQTKGHNRFGISILILLIEIIFAFRMIADCSSDGKF